MSYWDDDADHANRPPPHTYLDYGTKMYNYYTNNRAHIFAAHWVPAEFYDKQPDWVYLQDGSECPFGHEPIFNGYSVDDEERDDLTSDMPEVELTGEEDAEDHWRIAAAREGFLLAPDDSIQTQEDVDYWMRIAAEELENLGLMDENEQGSNAAVTGDPFGDAAKMHQSVITTKEEDQTVPRSTVRGIGGEASQAGPSQANAPSSQVWFAAEKSPW